MNSPLFQIKTILHPMVILLDSKNNIPDFC